MLSPPLERAAWAIGAKASVAVTATAKQGKFLIIGGFFLNQLFVNGGCREALWLAKDGQQRRHKFAIIKLLVRCIATIL